MQSTWITRGTNDKLRIVVLGWAADPTMVSAQDGFDTVCLYDYRNLEVIQTHDSNETKTSELKESDVIKIITETRKYKEIHLIAWSYGVWASEKIFHGQQFTSAVAVNGTPLPTDDKYGIPRRIFNLTVSSIEKAGTEKFVQRMCDGMDTPVRLQRADTESVEELRALSDYFRQEMPLSINWTKAMVGQQDLIFPPQSQIDFWSSRDTEIEVVPTMPHYPAKGIL